MQPIRPIVHIDGDNSENLMQRDGSIVGFDNRHVVWSFGYLRDSDLAKATGVSVDEFKFVLAKFNGDVVDEFRGFAIDLPPHFKAVVDWRTK
jgi:hypothetical protein